MNQRIAILIGATGMVGSQLLPLLLEDERFIRVMTFGRKSTGIIHPKLDDHVIDFERPEDWSHLVKGDVLFSAMGASLELAGSREAQFKVDYTYQYAIAKAASDNRVMGYVLVSAYMASRYSPFFFTRMKGKLEADTEKLRFISTHILRPAVLCGERQQPRLREQKNIRLVRFLNRKHLLRRWRPIDPLTVAKAMVNLSFGLEIMHETNLADIFEASQENFRSYTFLHKMLARRQWGI